MIKTLSTAKISSPEIYKDYSLLSKNTFQQNTQILINENHIFR